MPCTECLPEYRVAEEPRRLRTKRAVVSDELLQGRRARDATPNGELNAAITSHSGGGVWYRLSFAHRICRLGLEADECSMLKSARPYLTRRLRPLPAGDGMSRAAHHAAPLPARLLPCSSGNPSP